MGEFTPIAEAVIEGDGEKLKDLVNAGLADKVDPQSLLKNHLILGMMEVGKLMEEGEYFIPEVLKSAKAMNGALEILEPLLTAGERELAGYVILGTVAGDIHDIGKNLVGMLLRGNGFEIRDLGVGVPADKFVEAAQERDGKIVLSLSALLTPTMDEMPGVIKAIEDAGIRDRVKIMVGGAPITQEFADSIGSDGTAPDAAGAVVLAKKLIGS
jgi:5-methyltetrahydrofolate--homocysteine methyltransferase